MYLLEIPEVRKDAIQEHVGEHELLQIYTFGEA
jgi:hypothetical protein